ncbi:MAG: transposase [Bacteroidales bacterium]|nr:transposase [Bacteroidales bacterium]
MASSLMKIYVHVTFHVKRSNAIVIRECDLPTLFSYIDGIILNVGGKPFQIGGIETHVHVLAVLPKKSTVPEFVRAIKANTSRWLKTIDNEYYGGFAWQDGYGAFSVSPSLVEKTRKYIMNQKQHHQLVSYEDEYKQMLEAYNVDYDENYVFND